MTEQSNPSDPLLPIDLPEQASEAGDRGNVTFLPGTGRAEHLRVLEALLFAANEPLDEASLAARLPDGADLKALLEELQAAYAPRGVNLVCVAGKWAFRTAEDLAFLMRREAVEQKKLSRAAIETMAIIAYHQPTTRAEIEEIRGVAVNKGTLDVLIELGWVRIKGRRQTPGRPVTFGVTDAFLSHFGLESINDLPGLGELKAAGLLSSEPPDGFSAEMQPDPDAEHDEGSDEDLFAEEFDEDAADEAMLDAEEQHPDRSATES